jgi:hypothetical protein
MRLSRSTLRRLIIREVYNLLEQDDLEQTKKTSPLVSKLTSNNDVVTNLKNRYGKKLGDVILSALDKEDEDSLKAIINDLKDGARDEDEEKKTTLKTLLNSLGMLRAEIPYSTFKSLIDEMELSEEFSTPPEPA